MTAAIFDCCFRQFLQYILNNVVGWIVHRYFEAFFRQSISELPLAHVSECLDTSVLGMVVNIFYGHYPVLHLLQPSPHLAAGMNWAIIPVYTNFVVMKCHKFLEEKLRVILIEIFALQNKLGFRTLGADRPHTCNHLIVTIPDLWN